jgi:adenylate cyclase class IV
MIEIEKRALFTEDEYTRVLGILQKDAKDLGEDDKDVLYYIYEDKLMKLVNNLSKRTAKLSLKMNKLGDGAATREIEIPFDPHHFADVEHVLESIATPKQVIHGLQKRHNFSYKGCEIAMKWSKDYGYHCEIEKMTDDEGSVALLEKEIDAVAQSLGVIPMTDEEIQALQRKIEGGM